MATIINFVDSDKDERFRYPRFVFAFSYVVRSISVRGGIIHPEYGDVRIYEYNGDNISVTVDGRKRFIRIDGIDCKQKCAYIRWTFVDQKTNRDICSGRCRFNIDTANAFMGK